MRAEPQARAGPPLTRRLLLALLPPLTVLALIGAVIDYRQAHALAGAAYDQALANTAVGLALQIESDPDNDSPVHMAALAAEVARRRPSGLLAFVALAEDGHVLAGDLGLLPLLEPAAPAANPSFRDARYQGRDVRMVSYQHQGHEGRARIVVAEDQERRRSAARDAVRAGLGSDAAMVLAVLLVVTLGVKRGVRPLQDLGRQAAAQEIGDLRPLHAPDAPREIRPLVRGINQLIERLRMAHEAQHAFLDASAHQLRTPLAGLQAQLDVLCHGSQGSPMQQRLAALQASLQNLTHVTQQMLALARTEAARDESTDDKRSAVDLQELLQNLASDTLDAALARGIDLGLETAPAQVTGLAWMLREMLRNLLDNALRHAPAGSPVTLRCGPLPGGGAFAEVEDQGPGIPDAQRERVFERFVRLSDTFDGSGLGLAIVREVADRHGARVQLLPRAGGPGTLARVEFPAAPRA
ncbi:sensor histidine kinase [Aquabacterium sp.]|uniref:sensor histidine kinase n=1 Tax=Aquabacterium sp. TaxID=1872578 RepID=UPI0037844061